MVSRSHTSIGGPRAAALALALGLSLGLSASGCGASVATGKVEYSVSAKQNYEKGQKELEEQDWVAAAKYFAFVKARFPYSKYAVLAELRMADAEFGAGHYLPSIDSYKVFVKFHPTHAMVTNGYCNFRIAEAFTKMLPSDFWLLPPSYEKDQTAAADAELALRQFIKKYPKSPYQKKAAELLLLVANRLAQHEWYVAKFYWDKGKPMGTVLRLRRLLDRYKGSRYDADALWLLGRAYVKVSEPARAREVWQQLVTEHPKHEHASDAKRALGSLPAS